MKYLTKVQVPSEGISCSYSIIKQLNNISNNFSLITTHYDYLTTSNKYYNISNYHVKAIENKDFEISLQDL